MASLDEGQRAALAQAAHWYSRLGDDALSDDERRQWQAWLAASEDNRWAWQHAEALQQRLRGMPGPLASRTLSVASRPQGRRALLKGLLLLAGTAVLGWGGQRQLQAAAWLADYRSGVGERPDFTLADGSRLQLNSDSAADIHYDDQRRLIVLRRGELLLTSAADPRPLLVQTPDGLVQALGTRFSVMLDAWGSRVAVQQSQVRIMPSQGPASLLRAGRQCHFDSHASSPSEPLRDEQTAWSRGLLIANDQRLDEFLAELGRHRQGWLRCDPAIAGWRISGTFSLADTDQVLHALADSLPVQVERHTRYWVSVAAR